METFDVKSRTVFTFDRFMDMKKEGFGGPNTAEPYRNEAGKVVAKNKLGDYQRVIERHPSFSHPVNDPTYKAMTHDLVYKQAKKKAFDYDSYSTGIPVVNMERTNESRIHTDFYDFVCEQVGGETIVPLRGKTDKDAIGDAEEKMMQSKLSWDEYVPNRRGNRIDYLDANGDLVAYLDLPKRKLYVMPDAPLMSDDAHRELMAPSFDPDSSGSYLDRFNKKGSNEIGSELEETPEELLGAEEETEQDEDIVDPIDDTVAADEMDDSFEEEEPSSETDIAEVERKLKAFEEMDEEDEEELY